MYDLIHRCRGLRIPILIALFGILTRPAYAEQQWIRARLGSFEAVSDNGRKSAVQGLSQFEQFRYALGAAMGKDDLRLDPPLRIVVFRNEKELAASDCKGLRPGRDRLMACTVAEGQLAPELVKQLTRELLDENFANLPGATERAIEAFFSTVQSNSVHVTWGAPPPAADRTRDWALLHRLITQPDYAGRAHIFLHNLGSGMDSAGAIRSLSEDPAKFNAEIDRYFAAGVFTASQAPNRALNPDRDFTTTVLTSWEGQLARADLLNDDSAAAYQSLLKSGKALAEANEGLAVLAMRAAETAKARGYMEAARRAGTKNVVALTAYATLERDADRAIEILKEALTIDPKYAPAHWAFGEQLPEGPRRLAEWKQAVALAPRNYKWWADYAQLSLDQKQYAEAGRAWLAAAQAAPDAASRERYLTARGSIEELRLEDEAAVRRREATAKAAEIDRLKAAARKEIADLEARANSRPLPGADAKTVAWDEIHGGETVPATLVRVDCAGKEFRLQLRDETGKVQTFQINPQQLDISGGDGTLACGGGPQKPRQVKVTFRRPKTTRKQDASSKSIEGEITGIELP